jgi:hypothetical protein
MVETAATQQFIDALAVLERERDVERITGLFAPDSEVGNIVSPRRFSAWREHARSGRRTERPLGKSTQRSAM